MAEINHGFGEINDAKGEILHTCNTCECNFKDGEGGAQIDEQKFCRPCLDAYNHIDYYRGCLLDDHQIYQLLGEQITL